MQRSTPHLAWLVLAAFAGCGGSGAQPEAPVPVAAGADGGTAISREAAPSVGNVATGDAVASAGVDPVELKLELASFMAPGSWKRVDPPTSRIVDAEYTIPRAAGDDFDGRLTVMAAGGGSEANIERWTSEFMQPAGNSPKIEPLNIDGVQASWVDIEGDWKGSSFAPLPQPRPNQRLLAVIIPLTSRHDLYVKLIGPRQTLADRADEFREFAKSARRKLPPGAADDAK